MQLQDYIEEGKHSDLYVQKIKTKKLCRSLFDKYTI